MREAIIIGVAIGAFFFAGGGILTALAIKYATSSVLWDFVLWTGTSLMIASVATLALYVSSQLTGRAFLIPALLIDLGICSIAGGLVWHFSETHEASTGETTGENSIAVECHLEILPKAFGSNDSIRGLQLFPLRPVNGGGGLPIFYNRSGKEWTWPGIASSFPIEGYRCQITNYGKVPVFDFSAFLQLIFIKADEVPNQPTARKEGAITLAREWRIDAPKIDVGVTNAFVFYIFNGEADLFVHVLMPKTATMRLLGETKTQIVSLTVPQIGGAIPLQFGPRFDGKQAVNIPK